MARLREERRHAARTNDSWATDFGHDRLADRAHLWGYQNGVVLTSSAGAKIEAWRVNYNEVQPRQDHRQSETFS
ncbi:hypothetical protein MKW11_11975 [Gluconobacter frateurii]|uniref:hypothetical protein n=1 Tax=Gluconobacter frateurii TaxID=38308 RepID=UPI001F059944|nr:hypothetical protein [Gluconobacter frateurii]UMM10048.1 hypothetical protein MKW11_11975 [Gluconobacter frateurii]